MTTDCHLANLANLAELHLRRPLFKGTDPRNQLEEIMRVLKRPSDEDLEAIMNEGTPPLSAARDLLMRPPN